MKDPLSPADLLMVARDSIEEIAWSDSSMMPEGLLDSFTGRDILDLMAFLDTPRANGESRAIAAPASSVELPAGSAARRD